MTAIRRDGNETPFDSWIRNHPELDSRTESIGVTDSDKWIHKYRIRNESGRQEHGIDHLMLIEVKTHSKDVPFSQRDTLDVIDQLCRKSSVRDNGRRYSVAIRDRRAGRSGMIRSVRWLGAHVLRMSGDRPDNSQIVLWDMRDVTEKELIEILRFDRDPDHIEKFLDTRRHHRRPFKEQHLDMFSAARPSAD